MSPDPPSARFAETRWTRVLAARGGDAEAARALSDLCDSYYEPVLAFVRHSTRDPNAARDLTHDFFARLLARPAFEGLERGKGKFRSYLLGAVKHFLHDQQDRRGAARRGGGQETLPLESGSDSRPGLEIPDHSVIPSDAFFDREWAIALVARSLATLEGECEAAGRADHFAELKPWLTGAVETSQAETATKLGIAEGALKVAIHRLRKRYREIVKAEISQTIEDPREAEEEIRHLIAALGS
jgi:RNA polymerase sigma-70 factor (ECF subfamily)